MAGRKLFHDFLITKLGTVLVVQNMRLCCNPCVRWLVGDFTTVPRSGAEVEAMVKDAFNKFEQFADVSINLK